MDAEIYWADIDARLIQLQEAGYVKLPSISALSLSEMSNLITNEMGGRTFSDQSQGHALLLSQLGVERYLVPKLFDMAQKIFGYSGALSDQYHIARRVDPGNSAEMFRAHFDSHLFTLVLPLRIPKSTEGNGAGELIFCPNARRQPRSEIANIVGKVYHKRFASRAGMEAYREKHHTMTEGFLDYAPLLFIGNTTLHTNREVALDCSSDRLTLLSHFFDPSPRYGVGSLFRWLRNR
jgi:hypothetical protein